MGNNNHSREVVHDWKLGVFSWDSKLQKCSLFDTVTGVRADYSDSGSLMGGEYFRNRFPALTGDEVIVTLQNEGVIRIRALDEVTMRMIPEFNVKVGFSTD